MSNKPISDATSQEAPTPITLEALSTVPAISALGLVAARVLQQHGIVTLMVSTGGVIEVVPIGELELDRMIEPDALGYLLAHDYTDDQLADYLRQRDIRKARSDNNTSSQEHR